VAFTVSAAATNLYSSGNVSLKVYVVTGGSETGGASSVVCTGGFETPTFTLTPVDSNSVIVEGVINANSATALTPNSSNSTDDASAAGASQYWWDGHWTGTVTGGVAITTLGGTNDNSFNAFGAYEVAPSGSPAIDASTPAAALSATGVSPAVTASFTPPSGAVLVALVGSDGSAAQVISISDTSGLSLTWTQRGTTYSVGFEGTFAIFTTTMPGGAGPPLNRGPLPNFPAVIVTGSGWRGAGHSR
jgi:hypothetical protein